MNTSILFVVAVLAVLALAGVIVLERQRSLKLREHFGPEYEHVVNEYGDKRRAEAELAAREKRVKQLDIHPLTPEERDRFASAWQVAQARFVDEPSRATDDANRLVKEVMAVRGYPAGDFEQRAADISVDHPNVVTHYRAARELAVTKLHSDNGEVSTEDLRQAMVHYRTLFDDLLETPEQPALQTVDEPNAPGESNGGTS